MHLWNIHGGTGQKRSHSLANNGGFHSGSKRLSISHQHECSTPTRHLRIILVCVDELTKEVICSDQWYAPP